MRTPHLLILASCLIGAPALADGVVPLTGSDDRIKVIVYDPADVYTVTTRYGYQTNIVFSPEEDIRTISVGDRSLWQIIPSGHRLFIRPMEENVTTNMTILTSKRAYQFDLISLPNDKEEGNLYVAQFVYSEDMPPTPPSAMPAPAPAPAAAPVPPQVYGAQSQPLSPTPIGQAAVPGVTGPVHPNFNYRFSGPDELAPEQVYDNGQTTFIKYRDMSQPQPNVYTVDVAGKETLVTRYIRNGVLAVDVVAPALLLKNSNGIVTLHNETLDPQ